MSILLLSTNHEFALHLETLGMKSCHAKCAEVQVVQIRSNQARVAYKLVCVLVEAVNVACVELRPFGWGSTG